MNADRYAYNFMYYIELEISSLCNRSCSYCPASKIHRKRELLPVTIVEKIMKELQRINYTGGIAFHQFNEPLLELDHLIECIKCVKEYLPNTRMVLYTNGDFLTRKVYLKLKKLGIVKFYISCHLNKDETWSEELAIEKIRNVRNKLGYHTGRYNKSKVGVTYEPGKLRALLFKMKEWSIVNLKKYPIVILIESHDFYNDGSTRMGTVHLNESSQVQENSNTYYCNTLFHGMHVSYNGNVYLCCDCCDGTEEAKPYLLGSVYEEDICELFAKKFRYFESYVKDGGMKICQNCHWNK